MDAFLAIFGGYLGEFLAFVITGLLGWALSSVRRFTNAKFEAIMRDALHSAITTAVTKGDAEGNLTTDNLLDYIKRSVPDAINALKASDDILIDLIKSKVGMLINRNS